jgi:hypothetical protein
VLGVEIHHGEAQNPQSFTITILDNHNPSTWLIVARVYRLPLVVWWGAVGFSVSMFTSM